MVKAPKGGWRNILFFSKREPLLTHEEAVEILGIENVYGLPESLAVFGSSRVPRVPERLPVTARQLRLLQRTGVPVKVFLRYAPLEQLRTECKNALSIDRGVLDLYRSNLCVVKQPSYRVVIGPVEQKDEWSIRQLVKSLGLKLLRASLTTGLTGRLIDKVIYGHSPTETYLVRETDAHQQVIVISDAGKIGVSLARRSIMGRSCLYEIRAE